jgi:hypothetical protein
MRSALVRAAAAAVAGLLVPACASADAGRPSAAKPPSALRREVQAAVRSAHSVHMTGSVLTTRSQHVTFDLSFVGTSGLAGTMTVNGARLGLISVGGQTYIKISSSFLALAKAPATCAGACAASTSRFRWQTRRR